MAIFWTEENIRGNRAWQKYKSEMEAKGEKFEFRQMIPPPIPDEQNFATTPYLASLYDFTNDAKSGSLVYRDTNAFASRKSITLPGNVKSPGNWRKGDLVNFKSWLAAFNKEKHPVFQTESHAERKTDALAVLKMMEPFKPVMEELTMASHRPESRFPIHYQDANPSMILLPHLASIKSSVVSFNLRECAELVANQNAAALDDAIVSLRMSDAIKFEPFYICGLVRIASLQIALQPIWEGLATHQWTDDQLSKLEKALEKIDLLAEYGVVLRGERAFNMAGMDYMKNGGRGLMFEDSMMNSDRVLMPSGWFNLNKMAFAVIYQKALLPAMDDATHRVHAAQFANDFKAASREIKGWFFPTHIFASLTVPAFEGAPMKYAYVQSLVDQAIIACAIERYRLAKGALPETLDALAPQFLDHVPHDLLSGEPLRYQREGADRFTLYSIGWNEKDDAGRVVLKNDADKGIDTAQGDWVWPQYPQ